MILSKFLLYAKNHRILIHPETRKIGIRDTLVGWALIAFSTVLFQGSIKNLPLSLNFLIQFASGTVVLFIFGMIKGITFFRIQGVHSHNSFEKGAHLSPKQRKWILFWRGLIATGGYMLYSWARVSIGLIDNSAIFSMDAIVYALLIWIVLGEKLDRSTWIGIFVASFGVSFIFFFDFQFSSALQAIFGGIAGIISSCALAIIILMNTVAVQHEPPLRIAFYQCLLGLILALTISGTNFLIHWEIVYPPLYLKDLLYSVFAGIIYATALIFFFNAFLYTEPVIIAVLGYSLPPFVAFLEWVVAGAVITSTDIVSIILITLGGGLVLFGEHRNGRTTRRILSQPMYTLSLKERMCSIKEMYRSGELDKYAYLSQRHEFNKLLFQFSEEIEESDVSSIEIYGDGVIFSLKPLNIKMKCDGGCRSAPFEILNFGSYEEGEADLLFAMIKDGSVIFDIGAHLGWFTLNFAKRFPKSQIHAFEPIPRSFDFLNENLELNNVHRLKVNNLALSNKSEAKEFFYFKGGSALASTVNLIEHHKVDKITCLTKTLDEYCKENAIEALDFLKCDVEGGELFMIQGGLVTLKKFKPVIYIELYEDWCKKSGYTISDVVAEMTRMGYEFFGIKNSKLYAVDEIDEESESYNYFFLHAEKHRAEINAFISK